MKYSILLCILFTLFGSDTNQDPFDSWLEDIRQYNDAYPYEKVYVTTDKTLYAPGETIWLSGFVLDASDHTVSRQSEVLYIELIGPNGSLVKKLTLPVKAGVSPGSLDITNGMPGGRYRIRAYTQWMLNFSEDLFFEKEIPVQKVNLSRLLMTLDFEKEGYGPGDSVQANLKVRHLNNEPVSQGLINLKVKLTGQTVLSHATTTDSDGQADLNFILPKSLDTPDGILEVTVMDAGLRETILRSIPINLDHVKMEFFPEGGTWTYGSPQRIAFKALDHYGKGVDVTGEIRNQDNEIIAVFSSIHKGMGSFIITAQSGESFTAHINDKQEVPLPIPANQLYQLRLAKISDSEVTFIVTAPRADSVMLLGRSFGRIAAVKKTRVEKGLNNVTLSTDEFASGVGVFTLFDHNSLPVCERLIYVRNDDNLDISISTEREKYLPGEEIVLNVETRVNGKPIPAQVSLRVADEKLLEQVDDKQDHILSYMLLSSEIRGEIEEPVYYFDSTETDRYEALDNLLLTQGWRRYNWKDLNHKPDLTHKNELVHQISGKLKSKNGTGIKGNVKLLELSGNKRIVEIHTGNDGTFCFRNIDPGTGYLLLTETNKRIILDKPGKKGQLTKHTVVKFPDMAALPDIRSEVFPEAEEETMVADLDLDMASDVTNLSEVVVTGYGMERRSSLTSSVIYTNDSNPLNNIQNTLQGKVAGVSIVNSKPSGSQVALRGLGTGNSNDPLIVIDGVPVGHSVTQNRNLLQFLTPDNINTINVIKGPESLALFGSRAVNGVIFITTKNRLTHINEPSLQNFMNYTTEYVMPYLFSDIREFYQPEHSREGSERKGLYSTLFWDPVVVTGFDGKATVKFRAGDELTLYRVTAEGFSPRGNLGMGVDRIQTYRPLSIHAGIPSYIGHEDVLELPVFINNLTEVPQEVTLKLEFPDSAFHSNDARNIPLVIPSGTVETAYFQLESKQISGTYPIRIKVENMEYTDILSDSVKVRSVGFPRRQSYTGRTYDTTFVIPDLSPEKNSLKVHLNVYTNMLAELNTGMASLLREPHGCFEQVSSTTFPNILALQFMEQTGTDHPPIRKKALELLEKGYRKLAGYEIRGGGFDWFGNPPANEGLTAYGLLEFYEMNKVFSLPDGQLIDRTRRWLLGRRNGKGGFDTHKGKYGFSSTGQAVTDAYIVYALSATNTEADIRKEYQASMQEAWDSKDMYRMALMANASFHLNQKDNYEKLLNYFRFVYQDQGYEGWNIAQSMVGAYGQSLSTETLSLWILALLNDQQHLAEIKPHMDKLLSKRQYGRFGNSQATTVALMAITKYASMITAAREDLKVSVFVNGQSAGKLTIEKNERELISLHGLDNYMNPNGPNRVKVLLTTSGDPLPFSLESSWSSLSPESSSEILEISTEIPDKNIRQKESVRMNVTVRNNSDQNLPMTLARITIPAGLEPETWQLKELQEKQIFDYYEIINDDLCLYFTVFGRKSNVNVPLDLKAVVPGTFKSGPSSVYLYYADEQKTWIPGSHIVITE